MSSRNFGNTHADVLLKDEFTRFKHDLRRAIIVMGILNSLIAVGALIGLAKLLGH